MRCRQSAADAAKVKVKALRTNVGWLLGYSVHSSQFTSPATGVLAPSSTRRGAARTRARVLRVTCYAIGENIAGWMTKQRARRSRWATPA